ncbi:MAG: GAF domain-containing protein [Cyanobacteria bacterium SZAS-4]|nr:GAF domain-containing protein [Cyanobacteria bacterium SZAS-4]
MSEEVVVLEPVSDLYLKTEKLIFFRLAFAAVGMFLAIGINLFTRTDFDYQPVIVITVAVLVVSGLALLGALKSRLAVTDPKLMILNAVLIGSDVLALTALVHFTRGVESDLYVLYLLPILLSSYTFGREGITRTAMFVSFSYVGLLLAENATLLPYLLEPDKTSGLAAVYSQQLWRRILGRSTLLVSVAFIWGRFCEYMSGLAEQGANRLREQLKANEELVNEVKGQAAREILINSINSALRSTLDLNQIFETAVDELGRALQVSSCAIVCHSSYPDEPPVVCESISSALKSDNGDTIGIFNSVVCAFVLENKSTYERDPVTNNLIKVFVFRNPGKHETFKPIREEVEKLNFSSLVIQPMMYADESKGVLLIGERDNKRQWSTSELDLIKSVAGQVVVAIEHAELVDQLSRKNKDLLHKNLNLDAKNSELRTVQSQLIHQEKMASLGRLVAGIAHELNNPINFVHGNLPYLREYFDDLKKIIGTVDKIESEQKSEFEGLKRTLKYDFLVTDLDNILADLNEGADRIRHIIRNLRSFSRLDEAELKEASIQEGIESTLKILSEFYGRDKIPVETEFANIPPVLCYPGQLNQVWMNLLSNAAQALGSVSEPLVKIRTEVENNKVVASISDNGSGIKPEVQSKIFEPFFTTKPVGQGTGLGLSICHSIMERHGGQIFCESSPEEGTTFRVEIPIYARASDLVRSVQESAYDPD